MNEEKIQTSPAVLDQAPQYAGFWTRFCAQVIDGLCFLPLMGLSYWIEPHYKPFALVEHGATLLIGLWFNVYLVKEYGGSPGKLLLGLQVRSLDGAPVDYWQAALRYSVSFVLTGAASVAFVIATFSMPDADYYSLGFIQRAQRLDLLVPSWYGVVNILSNIWTWGESLIMLTNKRRRAPHDFIASTVVIRAPRSKATA